VAHVGGKNGKTGTNVGAGSIPIGQGLDGERVPEIRSARIAPDGSIDPDVFGEGPEDGVDDTVIEAGPSKRHEETVVFRVTAQLVSATVVSDERLGRGPMKREST
jgi:hypothetical protein